jgi:hypothetical protein
MPERRNGAVLWRVRCVCGSERVLMAGWIKRTASCGCKRGEAVANAVRVHGMSATPTGISWRTMLQRCYLETDPSYSKWGGRGIRVCEFLRASPVNLVALIGLRPEGRSLDRVDNWGHYSCGECAECFTNNWPLNIRWATPKEQQRNTRYNRRLTIHGQTRCATEWGEVLGIPKSTLFSRLRKGVSLLRPYKPKMEDCNG